MEDRLELLVAELEAATVGNEKLDRQIVKLLGISWSPDEEGQFGGYGLLPERVWVTRRLDAALLLVLKDYCWTIDGFSDGEGCASVYKEDVSSSDLCNGSTPALALCIAAITVKREDS